MAKKKTKYTTVGIKKEVYEELQKGLGKARRKQGEGLSMRKFASMVIKAGLEKVGKD